MWIKEMGGIMTILKLCKLFSIANVKANKNHSIMNDLFYDILNHMQTFEVNTENDITNFLRNELNVSDSIEDADKVIGSLGILRSKGYIDFNITTTINGRSGLPTHGGNFPISNFKILASLKQAGKEYLIQQIRQRKEDALLHTNTILSSAQLTDIPKNSFFRRRGYYVALAGVILMLLLWVIDKLFLKEVF